MNDQKLLTPQEVCELLGIKMSKLRSAIFRREIPIIKIGRLVRVSQVDLAQWLNQNKVNPENE